MKAMMVWFLIVVVVFLGLVSITIAAPEPLAATHTPRIEWFFEKDGGFVCGVTITAYQQNDDKESKRLAWECTQRLARRILAKEVPDFELTDDYESGSQGWIVISKDDRKLSYGDKKPQLFKNSYKSMSYVTEYTVSAREAKGKRMPRADEEVSCAQELEIFVVDKSGKEIPVQSYYMTVYSYQRGLSITLAHTWAVFETNTTKGKELHTISWMPAGSVRRARFPTFGVNIDHETSLRRAAASGCAVTMLGPYKIRPELYQLAMKREAQLNSGKLFYAFFDRANRPGATNCIHAITDMDGYTTLTYTAHGRSGGKAVVERLKKWIVSP